MSITKATTVWCDGPDGQSECGEWRETFGTAQSLRKLLSSQGWISYVGGRDMCPECVAEIGGAS